MQYLCWNVTRCPCPCQPAREEGALPESRQKPPLIGSGYQPARSEAPRSSRSTASQRSRTACTTGLAGVQRPAHPGPLAGLSGEGERRNRSPAGEDARPAGPAAGKRASAWMEALRTPLDSASLFRPTKLAHVSDCGVRVDIY